MFGNPGILRRCAVIAAGALVAVGASTVMAGQASAAPSPGVCTGGSILGGVYSSLTIAAGDTCYVDSGSVTVTGNLVLKQDAGLIGDTAGDNLTVKGNIVVQAGAFLFIGCAPDTIQTCFPGDVGSNRVFVGGKVTATASEGVLIVNASIKGAVKESGTIAEGCAFPTGYENDQFGSTVTITHVEACETDFVDNQVVGTVTFNNNFALGDNVISGNRIGGDLKCANNDPPPSGTDPNLVAGVRTGQCTSTSLP